ncbi:Tip elongation protein 1 [Ceratocystis lukuohia]|uniref:Tip elongation protein 1 n=1 Tax=Ceratocystis lukuohia TaxID=2019550 RepID=A0ABR4MTX1_9PEZI
MIVSSPLAVQPSSDSLPSLSIPRVLPRSLRKSASAIGLNSGSPSNADVSSAASSLHGLYIRPGSSQGIAPNKNNKNTYANYRHTTDNSSSEQLQPPPLTLGRKKSIPGLNPSPLASIPDSNESYASTSIGKSSSRTPLTLDTTSHHHKSASKINANMADDLLVGDVVDVPGGMKGTVRFVGSVNGKKGVFAGVELLPEFAGRGKNSGDVDGISYFTTTLAGAGIFVPATKVLRQDSSNSYPATPTITGIKGYSQNANSTTPPTPSILKFSQSVGPGRAASPLGKKPRPSLHRPESPLRRVQMTPVPRPSINSSIKSPTKGSKYGSPTTNKFSQSVRGTAGDPLKKLPGSRLDFKSSLIGSRSSSAMGMRPMSFDDEEPPVPSIQRARTNAGVSSASRNRPSSRAAAASSNGHATQASDEEVERLRAQVEDRDRQLRDQAATLAEMESALAEVQQLMENPNNMRQNRDNVDDHDTAQLRTLLREKNEKIALLTSEFDSHRADFRSTIDALEMASTETVRVYEAQKKDLVQEINELEARLEDVDAVARQLKQLEELVQELEEGLEDARRGEAEARGEVEFLRGEVERTRSELRREKEKNGGSAGNGSGGSTAVATTNGASASTNQSSLTTSKELEQKEDEIRGLKAIIHSLSRDSAPNSPPITGPSNGSGDSVETRLLRENQERQINELRAMLDSKTDREEELEREIEGLRRSGSFTTKPLNSSRPNSHTHPTSHPHRASGMTIRPSSLRDSAKNGISHIRERSSGPEPRTASSDMTGHKRGSTLDTMPESDTYSTATETSTLWCEICETNGHDILTCTNMFGPDGPKPTSAAINGSNRDTLKATAINTGAGDQQTQDEIYKVAPLRSKNSPPLPSDEFTTTPSAAQPPALAPLATAASAKVLPNPMESGPVAGKESGTIDPSKWCAVCERDGHDSVDCPFEDAF